MGVTAAETKIAPAPPTSEGVSAVESNEQFRETPPAPPTSKGAESNEQFRETPPAPPTSKGAESNEQFRETPPAPPTSVGVTAVESIEKFREIIKQDKYTVFDFWATWCGPCRMISPIFEKLADRAAEEGADVEFYKVDVDSVPEVAQEVGVKAMPTFFLFRDGKKVDELVGANPGALNNLIAKAK